MMVLLLSLPLIQVHLQLVGK
jgi:hypothetical protein